MGMIKEWFKRNLVIILFLLYSVCVLVIGNAILKSEDPFVILSDMCKMLAQVFITISLGYLALFAGLAAVFYKHIPQLKTFRNDLNADFGSIAFFVVSSVLMLMFSFVKDITNIVLVLTILAITNQLAFVMINFRVFKAVKKIMNIQK